MFHLPMLGPPAPWPPVPILWPPWALACPSCRPRSAGSGFIPGWSSCSLNFDGSETCLPPTGWLLPIGIRRKSVYNVRSKDELRTSTASSSMSTCAYTLTTMGIFMCQFFSSLDGIWRHAWMCGIFRSRIARFLISELMCFSRHACCERVGS